MSIKVLYCSPNKSHHDGYAEQLQKAGMLHAYISGFPRFGSGAGFPPFDGRLIRADAIQTAYIASLKARLPWRVSAELSYRSKLHIDRICGKQRKGADLFLHYSGCGKTTACQIRCQGGRSIVEAVNSHVQTQSEILGEEHRRLGLPQPRLHHQEFQRRVEEYEQADGILLPSEFVRRSFLQREFPEEKLIKLPYRPRIFFPGSRPPSQPKGGATFRILYVGSVQPRKGVRYLIEAFSSLGIQDKELWIVGAVSNPSGLEGLRIPKGVFFQGVLRGDELAHAYASSDVFCLPSLEEGMALVIGEALSFGLPVVTTPNSGAEDLITPGREGVIVPIRDVEGLSGIFTRMVDEPQWLDELALNALSKGRDLSNPESQWPLLPVILSDWVSRQQSM